jgi:hypothetical protein
MLILLQLYDNYFIEIDFFFFTKVPIILGVNYALAVPFFCRALIFEMPLYKFFCCLPCRHFILFYFIYL